MAKGGMKLLKALDVAKTQWYHLSAITIAGMGFLTDAYDLFSISCVTALLGRIYYHDPNSERPGVLPAHVLATVNGVALFGTLIGQLYFGWLGDKVGRKRVFGITLFLMIVSTVGSGISFSHKAKGVMTTICFFRFWLGVGIGGDYPLSATIMAEYANKRTRGTFIAAVFAMQGTGIIAASTVSIVVAKAFGMDHPSYEEDRKGSTPPEADYIWRIILMAGVIPAVLTYYWRMTMPETVRFTVLVAKNMKKATSDMRNVLNFEFEDDESTDDSVSVSNPRHQFGLFSKEFAKRHGMHLLGTSASWFLVDVAFYSQNLFQKAVFTAIELIPYSTKMNAVEEVYRIARSQALIALCSTIPGYWFTVAFIDVIGRKPIQIIGFLMMGVFMLAAAIPYSKLKGEFCGGDGDDYCHGHHTLFVVLYAFTFFFSNFGPNSTTFIIPAELFPARMRSTCHGISAAAGKAGAIAGTFAFLYASQEKDSWASERGYKEGIGLQWALIITAVTSFLGLFTTLLVPETRGRALEEIAQETDEEDWKATNELP